MNDDLLKKRNGKIFQTIFCLFAVVFCMACFFAASKTGQGDSEEKGGHQTQDASTEDMQDRLIIVSSGDESTEQEDKPLLSSESAEKNLHIGKKEVILCGIIFRAFVWIMMEIRLTG